MDHLPDYPEGREFSDLALSKHLASHDLLQKYLDMIVRNMNSEFGYLHFYDEETDKMNFKVWSGIALDEGPVTHDTHYQAKPSEIWTGCLSNRAPVFVNSIIQPFLVSHIKITGFEVKNYISFPIFEDDKIVAVVGVGNRPIPYSSEDLDRLGVYINIGWPIVSDLLKVNKEEKLFHSTKFIEQSHETILEAMAQAFGKALELRDEYTQHHQSNVAFITAAIARQLGLSKERSFGLNIGSLIHDIGKIVVPSQILNKTGKLLPVELEVIKLHTTYGREMFEHLSLPWPIADMIGQHHERMDGSGYPSRLKGSSICLEARIIAVADTYDAMSGDRPYRHAPGQDEAVSTIMKDRAKKYDPYVVDAFIEALEENDDIKRLYA